MRFEEKPTHEFGRIIMLTAPLRGGEKGGPVCRYLVESRTGALVDLGRIDAFAVQFHHHTQYPVPGETKEAPIEKRTNQSDPQKVLNSQEWTACVEEATNWMRHEFLGELKEAGWGPTILKWVEEHQAAIADASREHLLANQPEAVAQA